MLKIKSEFGEQTVLLDQDDFDRVGQYTWCVIYRRPGLFHAMRKENKKTVFMHRFILNLHSGDPDVDHINGNGLDNRKENLRLASPRMNALNSDRSRNAKIIEAHGNRFRVRPFVNGKRTFIGSFTTYEEAEQAVRRYKDGI